MRWCESLWGLPQLQNTNRKQHTAWHEPRVPQELTVLPGSHCSLPHPHPRPRGSAHPKPMPEGAGSQASWAGGRLPPGLSWLLRWAHPGLPGCPERLLPEPPPTSLPADAPPHSPAALTPLPPVLSVRCQRCKARR